MPSAVAVIIKPQYVTRLLNAARKGGLEANGVEILPDGTIRILKRDGEASAPLSPLDAFRAKKNGSR